MKAMTSRKKVTKMIKKPVINVKLKRSSQAKERRKSRRILESKLKNERSIISTAMEVKGQEMMLIRKHANLTVQRGREVTRQGRSERVEDRESTSAGRWEEEEVSSHGWGGVSSSDSHASHLIDMISTASAQCSSVQRSRKGLALWWLIILPGWVITPVGPGKDTHGTPVPTQWGGRGWPDQQISQQRLDRRRNQKLFWHIQFISGFLISQSLFPI